MTKEWIEIPLSVTDKIGQWAIWAGVKLAIVAPGIVIYSWKQLSRLSLHIAEQCERFYCKLLIPLDAIPYGGMQGAKLIEVEAKALSTNFDVCNDILEVLEGKHALLIGGSGDGKTTTAMYIAYSIGGSIKVYDADAAADEWRGLNVVGRSADFAAIDAAMQADIEELQQRTILRAEKGSHACDGMDCVTIAEEFPLLVGEVESAADWLIKHGKRGRRVKKFILAIAQNDTVTNFGIQGDSGVIDSFRMIRLGKKALAHARRLKNEALAEWLRGDRGRILVDDVPVQLPPYREIQRVIQQGSHPSNLLLSSYQPTSEGFLDSEGRRTAESDFQPPEGLQNGGQDPQKSPENQGFQALEGTWESQWESKFWQVWQAIAAGRSNYWIGGNVFGIQGGSSYQKLCERLEEVRHQGLNEGE
jgi:hypothetical protein